MVIRGNIGAAIASADEALRAGDAPVANQIVSALLGKRLARPWRAPVAALARRLRRPEAALRLLHSVVRPVGLPSSHSKTRANDEEKAEYAASLIRLGALNEADRLLDQCDVSRCSDVDLFRAFAHIHRWDYEPAIPLLKTYTEAIPSSDYRWRIAQVNWIASLVAIGDTTEALSRMALLSVDFEKEGNHLLRANLIELAAQAAVIDGRWDDAIRLVAEGISILSGTGLLDSLLLRKWGAIARLKKYGSSVASELISLRAKAEISGHWETVRDLDYHLALVDRDSEKLALLYFGTPAPRLQERYAQALAGRLPSGVNWTLGKGPLAATLNERTGESDVSSEYLKPGQLLHRLLTCLTSDFYRPRRLLEIFEGIYPGQRYAPLSSPNRVYQAINRLKRHFYISGIPLSVIEGSGFFRLDVDPTSSCSVVIACERLAEAPLPLRGELRAELSGFYREVRTRDFRASDVVKHTGWAVRTTTRRLALAVSSGELRKLGSGAATRYCFSSAADSNGRLNLSTY